MRTVPCLVAALALVTCSAAARSANRQAAAAWQALTRTDLKAARALLLNNDPATVPAVGDTEFIARLRTAYARALARTKSVAGYPGYTAVLGAFANALDDGHLWFGPRYIRGPLEWAGVVFRPASIEWAGLVTAKRQSRWVIVKQNPNIVRQRLLGARLIACADMPIGEFARKTLGSYPGIVWSDQAMRVLAAPWLLVYGGNPFVRRPARCTVQINGVTRRINLRWTYISRTAFRATIRGTVHGNAGYALRAVGPGYWIGLQSLTPKAQGVIDAVKARAAALRSARYVVIDLRGDGGGDDAYGRALAEALYGTSHVESVLGPNGNRSGCPEVWRASPGNIAASEASAKMFEANGDLVAAREYRAAVVAMRAALARHRPMTGAPRCTLPKRAMGVPAPSLVRGHVIVLTDSVCFSSCINTVDFFKKLGATLVGQTTGTDTHYSEERIVTLPSGLGTFSTLQAILPDMPAHIGPFAPAFPYYGDITDTAALERWIAETVVPELRESTGRNTPAE
jgi:hypothetical protein